MTMRFGAFTALEAASMRVRAGAFHALLGENGAGKSTLVKCVIGYQRPTFGDVLLDNKEVVFESPRDAHAAGIGETYQRCTLVAEHDRRGKPGARARPRARLHRLEAPSSSALEGFMGSDTVSRAAGRAGAHTSGRG